ncbi:MAG: hypothetical protein ACLQVW_09080, partial [Limisphaerales bacterium]
MSSDWFDPNNWSPVGVPGAVDTVNFATGTINLTAAVTIGGQFNWSGGTLEGSPLTVGSNAVMNLLGSGTLSLYGPLTNEGTVNWTGNCDLLVQNYNGTYGYSGGIVNQAGAIWNIQCDQTIQANGGYGGTPYFNNAGLLRKSGGTGTNIINALFNNNGAVDVESGAVMFNGGGGGSGTFNAGAGDGIG